MIVPMKKVTVLCLEDDRDATLEHLRALGILHLAPVRPPEDRDVEAARRALDHVQRALDVLPHHPSTAPSGQSPQQVIEAVWSIIHRRRDLEEERTALRHERLRIAPFGRFDPAAVRELADRGVQARLYQADPRRPVAAPEGWVLRELSRSKSAVFFALAGRGEPPSVDAREVRLPELSLERIDARLSEIEDEFRALGVRLDAFGGDYPVIAARREEAHAWLRFAEARAGMGAESRVAYLRGFVPAENAGCIREAAAQGGWGVLIEDPAEGDRTPTLIRTPRWVRPVQAVFRLIGVVPGYREVDVSAVFLVFFSLFFAMIVGDAGYGAVFLGLTLWARRRFPNAPPQIFPLLTITSVCTIVWGVLSGSWFGVTGLPLLSRAQSGWLTDPERGQDRVMHLCFLIGAVQLTIAHVWNAWRARGSLRMLAQIGWVGTTWGMYAAANAMVLGRDFPPPMTAVLGGGVVLIALFMTPVKSLKTAWMNHVMLPLNLINNFVDVVSYIRLFAVGTATLAVAQAFNAMAVGDGIRGWLHGLVAAVVLLLGHTLNITLAAMGVIVHGVRLNTLEFSGHLGMEWTGIPYAPFAERGEKPADAPRVRGRAADNDGVKRRG